MLPALIAGVSGIYSVGKMGSQMSYWNDYYANTGIRPKYPFSRDAYGFDYGFNALKNFGSGYAYGYFRWARGYHPSRMKSNYGYA